MWNDADKSSCEFSEFMWCKLKICVIFKFLPYSGSIYLYCSVTVAQIQSPHSSRFTRERAITQQIKHELGESATLMHEFIFNFTDIWMSWSINYWSQRDSCSLISFIKNLNTAISNFNHFDSFFFLYFLKHSACCAVQLWFPTGSWCIELSPRGINLSAIWMDNNPGMPSEWETHEMR